MRRDAVAVWKARMEATAGTLSRSGTIGGMEIVALVFRMAPERLCGGWVTLDNRQQADAVTLQAAVQKRRSIRGRRLAAVFRMLSVTCSYAFALMWPNPFVSDVNAVTREEFGQRRNAACILGCRPFPA